jgi:CheY-like chemotaxis protein
LQPTDLPAVVRAAVETTMAAAEAKSIDLRVTTNPRAGTILGDPQRLQQALWNILSNALKATPSGGKIQVRLMRINSHIELSVTDSGSGIDPALLPHVFDRFFQADAANEGNRKGMGLGLTIVKHIIAMHGGSVTAHSDGIGKGATFTLRLPLPTTIGGFAAERRSHPTVADVGSSARIPRLNGFEMLVVDDDQEATEALKALLKSLGADVVVAASADRALEILAEHHPDVVVSDIGMPGRDGLALAREIRSREQNCNGGRLPLVALTAYGRVEDEVEIFAAGFDSHVVKPVDPAELAAVIKSIVAPNRDRLLL